jgi:hypothetical protein
MFDLETWFRLSRWILARKVPAPSMAFYGNSRIFYAPPSGGLMFQDFVGPWPQEG